ncbi:MAG: hypothetical protein EBW39_03270 [Betaproteobacteria bacterium]|nr:hypothetical protein [Betaproteobacteria bacterium]
MADQLLRFMLQGGSVRGEIVRLEQAWQQVVQRHQLPFSLEQLLLLIHRQAMLHG